MKRHLPAAVLAALALAVPAAPGAHADEIRLPADTPAMAGQAAGAKAAPEAQVHTVQKGDTLWDIAQSYLEDPFQWPKIWRDNGQVVNPDLIYPGGRIRIPFELLKPEVKQAMAPAEAPPEVVEVPVPKGTLNPLVVEAAGFITDDLDDVGKVMGTYEGRNLMGEGDTIFLRLSGDASAEPGTRYTIVRPIHKVHRYHSARSLGHLYHVLGVAEVTDHEGRAVQARVERSYDSILAGDRLVPYAEPDVTVTEGTPDVNGYVVATRDDRPMSATGDVVYLDRGAEDGLAPGMPLTVLAPEEKVEGAGLFSGYTLPPRQLATLRVLSVRAGNATAKVEASTEPIRVGSHFEAPPVPAPDADLPPSAGPASGADSGA